MAGTATPATTMLTRLGIEFTVHTYEHDRGTEQYGTEAVDALSARLGVSADRVFKTLVTSVDGGLVVGLVPVAAHLDLEMLAGRARLESGEELERGLHPGEGAHRRFSRRLRTEDSKRCLPSR